MKLKLSLTATILTVAVAAGACVFLYGCASTGDATGAAETGETSPGTRVTEEQGSPGEQSSQSNPEARQETAAAAAGSDQIRHVREPGPDAEQDRSRPFAASLSQAVARILPGTLPDLDWNRIATILVGILMMASIYGLAFALARLPGRRRGSGSR